MYRHHVALTVHQPYAWMILEADPMADGAAALKPIENREWRTDYRGPLWIHAGKSRDWMRQGLADLARLGVDPPGEFVFGALVGLVELIDCASRERLPQSLRRHPTAEGKFCWVLERPRRLLEPIPMRGALGLFDVPSRVLAAAELERRCRECGCTDEYGCAEGCYWVRDDLCSQCGERDVEDHENARARKLGTTDERGCEPLNPEP